MNKLYIIPRENKFNVSIFVHNLRAKMFAEVLAETVGSNCFIGLAVEAAYEENEIFPSVTLYELCTIGEKVADNFVKDLEKVVALNK